MKKVFVLLIALITTVSLHAQEKEHSFQQNTMVLDGGIGLGIYGTHVKDLPNGTLESDSAGAIPYFISFEYGIFDIIGAGIQLGYSNYIEGDSSNDAARANGMDLLLKGNIHFIRTKHTDMFIGVDYGFSDFSIKNHDTINTKYTAGGTIYGANLESRFYFGGNFGVFVNVGYHTRTYPKVKHSNDSSAKTEDFWFQLHGVNFGAGLVLKL